MSKFIEIECYNQATGRNRKTTSLININHIIAVRCLKGGCECFIALDSLDIDGYLVDRNYIEVVEMIMEATK